MCYRARKHFSFHSFTSPGLSMTKLTKSDIHIYSLKAKKQVEKGGFLDSYFSLFNVV